MSIETVVKVARFLKVPAFLKMVRLYKPTKSALQKLSELNWKRRAKRLYSQFIRMGDIAFDVGANRGTRVEIFRKLGAIVVAIEPQEHCIRILRERFKNKVFFEQVALGISVGEAEMMINDDEDGKSTLSKEFVEATIRNGMTQTSRENWNRIVTVKVNTLDNLISKYGQPSFCKIDVEGFEYEVLMGLSHPIAALSIEFVPALYEASLRCINHLKALGFTEYNYSMGESMRLGLPHWVTDEGIINVVAAMPRRMVYGDIYARRGKE
jgi:FkbM family methyltransferase